MTAAFDSRQVLAPDTCVFQAGPRLAAALYGLCPALPPDAGPLYPESVQDGRRGLIFHYPNGGDPVPMTARVTVVFFLASLYGYRMRGNPRTLQQEEAVSHRMELAIPAPGPRAIPALRRRYTNYFRRCIEEHTLFAEAADEEALCRYMLISDDEWYDVLSAHPPRVFTERFGARLSAGELNRALDAIYYP